MGIRTEIRLCRSVKVRSRILHLTVRNHLNSKFQKQREGMLMEQKRKGKERREVSENIFLGSQEKRLDVSKM